MVGYHLSDSAITDLANIQQYLRRWSGDQIARRVIARIRDSFELLAEQPRLGVECPYLPGLRSHFVPGTRHIILYSLDRTPVEIHRVLHGSQDIEKLFG